MDWRRILAYVTGTVDRELLLRNELPATENRILRVRIKGRVHVAERYSRSAWDDSRPKPPKRIR